jgi:hypothetical protein
MQQTKLIKDERSLGDLFSELASETSTLVKQEVALAQVELDEQGSRCRQETLAIWRSAGQVGYAAFLTLLAAIVV